MLSRRELFVGLGVLPWFRTGAAQTISHVEYHPWATYMIVDGELVIVWAKTQKIIWTGLPAKVYGQGEV